MMKKRILSLILLVAMIVTALPLMAVCALATQPAPGKVEYTADEYTSLMKEIRDTHVLDETKNQEENIA